MAEPKRKDKDHDESNESFEKFEDLTKKLLKVPKEEVDRLRGREKKEEQE